MATTISVVIPALNEAEMMPRLLDQLGRQTMRPTEVIVADAGSIDETPGLASGHGALVVNGGKPAEGRNAGARAATSELILFIDADVDLNDDTIATLFSEFDRRALVVGTAHIEPLERTVENLFACEVANLYLDLMQFVSPHAPGFCIMVQRAVHELIGGFDESLALAEDHDYVQRASRLGKFRVMQETPVRTSMRRIEKEGLLALAFKYVYCEIFVIAGKPITHVPFEYEFASFGDEVSEQRFSADLLRERLGEGARSLSALPAEAMGILGELARSERLSPERVQTLLAGLRESDISALRRYVDARVRLARMKRGAVLRRFRAAGDRVWTEFTSSIR